MHHPESDSLFEVFGQQALNDLWSGGIDGQHCSDVTGLAWAEYAFRHNLPPQPQGDPYGNP